MANQPQWKQSAQNYLQQAQEIYKAQEVVVKTSFKLVMSIFAVAFFTLFALGPTLGSISTLVKRIEDQKEVNRKLDSKIVQLSQAEEVLASRGDELRNLAEKAVTDGSRVDRLAQQIEAIANDSGVYLTSANVEEVPVFGKEEGDEIVKSSKFSFTPEHEFVTFSFTVGGGQEEIVEFLKQLENLERAVLLARVSFEKPQKKLAGQLPLLVSGKATIYYLPDGDE